MNVHKKCEKRVAPLCGVNQKILIKALEDIRKSSAAGLAPKAGGSASARSSAAVSSPPPGSGHHALGGNGALAAQRSPAHQRQTSEPSTPSSVHSVTSKYYRTSLDCDQ